jgi:hypothetical protein
MKITDGLRMFIEDPLLGYASQDQHVERLTNIADRIDAEYEKAIRELNNLADASVLLPVDADGVPIRVGDVMEWPTGETFEVAGIGDGTLFYIEDDGEYADWTGAITKRHHHALTVEDVLRQVIASANNGTHVHGALDTEQIVAEYASKLRLASDE